MAEPLERLTAALADRYRIERELGAGGMATVYLAEDLRHHRKVAVKVLRPDLAASLGPERFLREIRTAGNLSHPHIVPIFDSGEIVQDGSLLPFYVMPYIEGESLRQRLQRDRQLSVQQVLSIAKNIGAALAHAHAHGIIHRDVKPENILIDGETALLTDFGIARATAVAGADRLTSTGMAVGTPAYMSPEQAAGDAAVDARTDIYSLAAVVYEMLGGEAPFSGATPQAVLARQISGEVRPLHTIRPSVSPEADRVLRLALGPAPADRPATLTAFVGQLEAGLQQDHPDTTRTSRRLIGVLAMIATAVVVTGLYVKNRVFDPFLGPDGRLGVAMMPFQADGQATSWSEAMPDLISTLLDGVPGVWVADPWSLWVSLRATQGSHARSPDPAEAGRLAHRVRARRYVLGRIATAGSTLQLNLRIYSIGRTEPLASFEVSGQVDSVAAVAQRAAVGVLSRAWEGESGPTIPKLHGRLPQSLEAIKQYLLAREALRKGLPDSADAAITRALGLDSTFAIALIDAIAIRSWEQSLRGQVFQGLRALTERAMPYRDSLPLRYRLRLDASAASVATDGRTAAMVWQQLLAHDSSDVDAWNGLAYVHQAYGWQYGITEPAILAASERAFQQDSNYAPALFRRALVTGITKDPEDAKAQLHRLRIADSNSAMLYGMRLALEALLASDVEYAQMADTLERLPPYQLGSVITVLRWNRPDRALTLARRIRASSGRMAGIEANLLMGTGRVREADSLRGAGAYGAVPEVERYLRRAVVANALLGIQDSAVTRDALAALSREAPRDSAARLLEDQRGDVWRAGWLQGAFHASLGDTVEGRLWSETLGRLPEGGSPRAWAQAERSDLLGRIAERHRLTDSAWVLARAAYDLWTIHTENIRDDGPEPALRFRLAEVLRAAGANDSASAIYRSLVPPTSWFGGYTTRSLLALGELAEERGDRMLAARYYDHALQFWELGGEEAGVWRRRAEDGLKRTATGRVFRYGQRGGSP